MNPSAWPELEPYPALRELFERQMDIEFADIRTLLLLPERKVHSGCSLALALLLFNLVSGASVLFYKASLKGFTDQRNHRQRFKGLLHEYYPWSEDDLRREDATDVLWDGAQNPLMHQLRLGPTRRIPLPGAPRVQGTPVTLIFGKEDLTAQQIEEVATSRTRPSWLKETVWLADQLVLINVPAFAWGVHEMIRRLLSDERQATQAEQMMLGLRAGAPTP